jgi:hypothetical protein
MLVVYLFTMRLLTYLVNDLIDQGKDMLAAMSDVGRTVAAVKNLSDRQYCCVWSVEVDEEGYRPEKLMLLAGVARHGNPFLRVRGWRVKRLNQ